MGAFMGKIYVHGELHVLAVMISLDLHYISDVYDS